MKFSKMLIAVAAVAAFGVGQADAGTITQIFSYGPQATDWTATLNFNQFNGPGQLLSVEVIEKTATTDSGTVTDQNTNTVKITLTVGAKADTTGPGSYANTNVPLGAGGTYTLAHNASHSFGPVTSSASADTLLTSPADLAPYKGTGTVSFTTTTTDALLITGALGNINATVSTDVTETITVIYNYQTPGVPEIDSNVFFSALTLLVGCVVVFFGRKAAFVA